MADPATDNPFPTSTDSASSYLTAPDVPSKAPDTRGDNVIDLFPTKKQVEGATTALTDIQEHKIKEEDVLLRSFNQRDEQNRAWMVQAVKAQGAEIGRLKPWNAQEELGKRETSLWEQFGSPGFLIAMMGSAFSAQPMNSALTAGGAAIQALEKGKMDNYQRAFDAWKQNTDLVIKRQQMERELYEEIDHLRPSDMAAWRSKATAIMTRFDDQRKLALLQNGMEPEVLQAIDAQAKAAGDMAKVRDDLDARNRMIQYVNTLPEWKRGNPAAMQRAIAEYNDPSNPKIKAFNAFMDQYYQENGASPPPDKIQEWQTQWSMAEKLGQFRGADAPLWERAVQMFPGEPQQQADWVAAEKQKGKTLRPEQEAFNAFITEYKDKHNGKGPSAEELEEHIRGSKTVRSPAAMAMLEYIEETKKITGEKPTAEQMQRFMARGGALSAAERAFSSGAEGKLVRSLNVSFTHLETFRELGRALKNGDLQAFNKIAQDWAQQTGNPVPTNFDLAKRFIGPEIVKALVQGGGGVTERTGMEEAFNRIGSPDQIDQGIDTVESFLAGQFKGLEHQYEQTTGETNFTDKLIPQARTVYERLSGKIYNQKQPVAVGPNTEKDPEGTKYRKDGWVWEKRGKQIVPVEALK